MATFIGLIMNSKCQQTLINLLLFAKNEMYLKFSPMINSLIYKAKVFRTLFVSDERYLKKGLLIN